MDTKQIHVNDYANLLLSNRQFQHSEYRKFIDNCYTLHNLEGIIAPDILNALIRKAKWNRKICSILTDILWYADRTSISDDNFRLLLQFPPKARNTFLMVIGHMELAFYQMQIINRVAGSFEAFAWLFDRICENTFFTEEDMLQILRDASNITCFGIQACIDLCREKHGNSSKLSIAEAWVKKMNANQK
ncbi:MAG: hypothetical protein IJ001_11015 [Oscillospiraceae bacterium]|nr:hypothetical protein [Oscillospiraceae bacterium]